MPDNSVSRQTPRAVLDYSAHKRAQRKAPYMCFWASKKWHVMKHPPPQTFG